MYCTCPYEKLDGPVVRRAITEVKQHWSVIGWVTKNFNFELLLATECTVKPLVPHWARVVGYGPFSLCVIHKDCAPAVGTLMGWWWLHMYYSRTLYRREYRTKILGRSNRVSGAVFITGCLKYRTAMANTSYTALSGFYRDKCLLRPCNASVILVPFYFLGLSRMCDYIQAIRRARY
jgi:hypothetical protein